MLALIAGRGALPLAVSEAVRPPIVICAMHGSLPDRVKPDHVFRLEALGGFLAWLRRKGVTEVCFCGAVDRPKLSWWRLDLRTLALLPRIRRALRTGDDSALRIAISVFEDQGLTVRAAHEVAPELLPVAGCLTQRTPDAGIQAAMRLGDQVSLEQARADLGQACVIRDGTVLVREAQDGTDAMLDRLAREAPESARGAVLYKAPKPGQERRADLPVIGLETAQRIGAMGFAGIVIEAGGVMVLDQEAVLATLDARGAFLWVRERQD
ncbi:LpxI family protein [Cognatishimia sp. F0-27]|uniref:LpxI family protein n=1 Tax=Cognatishimia sp. F0-27 TaxID=2816855 RepID=UPI001D0CB6BF|nr:UDP-2,3-diacylglucosamine diphosphatase LpxI [Cognatishimia sp. F0-27]MCC1493560.1 UDP-2,3-diacylglucosamine diphosphatase LpxI [Cognatishimia sp. F0-27]